MYIPQIHLENLKKFAIPGKVIILYGPRRCGKTTLLEHYQSTLLKTKILFVTGDDIHVREYLSSQSLGKLQSFIGDAEVLMIDEAQRIPDIGLNLKLIIDHMKNISIIATGSSAFDLARHVGEPLTGRKITLRMFPLSQLELSKTQTRIQTDAMLESRLIYGSYPEVILAASDNDRKNYLSEILSSYLFKDILELDNIRHSEKLLRLLQCLAFQIGKGVSITELGTQLAMSKNTVDRYLELLEKTFVIFRMPGFSRNLRTEISKSARYYFCDVGIRNALINRFNPLSLRDDMGLLWENYIIVERLKKQNYTCMGVNNYFWRTYDQKEIDLIEEREGRLFGYEMKWSTRKVKSPKGWLSAYANAEYQVIDRENYSEFIS